MCRMCGRHVQDVWEAGGQRLDPCDCCCALGWTRLPQDKVQALCKVGPRICGEEERSTAWEVWEVPSREMQVGGTVHVAMGAPIEWQTERTRLPTAVRHKGSRGTCCGRPCDIKAVWDTEQQRNIWQLTKLAKLKQTCFAAGWCERNRRLAGVELNGGLADA